MSESMTAADYQRTQRNARHTCPTCGKKHGGRNKLGAVGSRDPETGEWIPSKFEARVLARLRAEADAKGWIAATHPRCRVEGGHATADVALIAKAVGPSPDLNRPWFCAWVLLAEAKGVDHPAGRKSRKQVRERMGIEIEVIRK